MYIDIHTHKNLIFKDGLYLMNLNSSELPPFSENKKYYSSGLHPCFLNKEKEVSDWAWLSACVNMPEVLAVGECGLDKSIETDFAYQMSIFEKQIEMTEKIQKPLILHIVRAFQELIYIKKRLNPSVPMIVHGFRKKKEIAADLIRHGFYVSYGAALLDSPTAMLSFENTSLDKIFLETDMADVSLLEIYEQAAKLKNVTVIELTKRIEQNFLKVFGKEASSYFGKI